METAALDQLFQLLHANLAATGSVREQSEKQLTFLLSQPGFALQLCEFIFASHEHHAERHLACILLKRLIQSHWSFQEVDDDEEDNAETEKIVNSVSEEEKNRVRALLLDGLHQKLQLFAKSTLQTALCLIFAAIFERDWPDNWKELFPVVLQLIANPQNSLQVEFAIRFLHLACDHVASELFVDLINTLFPHLQRIFVAKREFSPSIRARVVSIVQTCLVMVGIVAQSGDTKAQTVLHTSISPWISLFLEELVAPAQALKDYSPKMQILSSLTAFVKEWPKDMSETLSQVLPLVYAILKNDIQQFEKEVIFSEEEEEGAYDSDGEGTQLGRSALVLHCLEFLLAILQAPTKKTRKYVLEVLQDFVVVMIPYMQIPTHQMQIWHEDPNRYIADEDDDSLSYSCRNAAIDLVSELDMILGSNALVIMLAATQSQLTNTQWRVQEASLLVIGTLSSSIQKTLKSKPEKLQNLFDISSFLETLFAIINNGNNEVYLRARALWCASRFAKQMRQEMLDALLTASISGLDQGQMLPIRMYACRAISAFLTHDKGKGKIQQAAHEILNRLGDLASRSSQETMHIALETMVVVINGIESLSVELATEIVKCFLSYWSQNMNDPMVAEFTDQAFAGLLMLGDMDIIVSVHQQVLPVLQSLLLQSRSDLGASGSGVNVASSVIVVLKALLRHSFSTQSPSFYGKSQEPIEKIGTELVQQVFEPLVDILHEADDERILSGCSECLKWLVMFAVGPLSQLCCTNPWCAGISGVECTMNMAAKMLSPSVPDASAVNVGGLITQILLKVGPSLPTPTIHSILQAVCARLADAELPSLTQSLCMVFARLIHLHGSEILDHFEQLPVPGSAASPLSPSGRRRSDIVYRNMLEFIFGTWIEKQLEFYGVYCIKVTLSALVLAAQWKDPRIDQLIVTGSVIENSDALSSGIRTRSQSKSAPIRQYTKVHFVSKLATVLMKTMHNLNEEEEPEWDSSEEEDDDEDKDGETESSTLQTSDLSSSVFAPASDYELLSDRLDATCDHNASDEDEDDQAFEAQFDPLNDLDLKVELPNALRALCQDSTFAQFGPQELSSGEQEMLGRAVSM